MVRVVGFEPTASRSRTVRDTKLRYTLIALAIILITTSQVKANTLYEPFRIPKIASMILGTSWYNQYHSLRKLSKYSIFSESSSSSKVPVLKG